MLREEVLDPLLLRGKIPTDELSALDEVRDPKELVFLHARAVKLQSKALDALARDDVNHHAHPRPVDDRGDATTSK